VFVTVLRWCDISTIATVKRYDFFTTERQWHWNHAFKFVGWQHPAVGRGARFAFPRITCWNPVSGLNLSPQFVFGRYVFQQLQCVRVSLDVCSFHDTVIVLVAMGMTVAVCLSVSIFAIQTRVSSQGVSFKLGSVAKVCHSN